jgi:hypothetical protein
LKARAHQANRRASFLSPPEPAHRHREKSMGKKRRRSFDTAVEYGTVAMMATEKTRTAKPAVGATHFDPPKKSM